MRRVYLTVLVDLITNVSQFQVAISERDGSDRDTLVRAALAADFGLCSPKLRIIETAEAH